MTATDNHQTITDGEPVLPPGYVASVTDPTLCQCQWGSCGHCSSGEHDRCARTLGFERRGPSPETYVVSRRWVALTPVWRVGRACRWLCSCSCHVARAALPPVQLTMFEVNA